MEAVARAGEALSDAGRSYCKAPAMISHADFLALADFVKHLAFAFELSDIFRLILAKRRGQGFPMGIPAWSTRRGCDVRFAC